MATRNFMSARQVFSMGCSWKWSALCVHFFAQHWTNLICCHFYGSCIWSNSNLSRTTSNKKCCIQSMLCNVWIWSQYWSLVNLIVQSWATEIMPLRNRTRCFRFLANGYFNCNRLWTTKLMSCHSLRANSARSSDWQDEIRSSAFISRKICEDGNIKDSSNTLEFPMWVKVFVKRAICCLITVRVIR